MQSEPDKSKKSGNGESEISRRDFVATSSGVVAAASISGSIAVARVQIEVQQTPEIAATVSDRRTHSLGLRINNQLHSVAVDTRTTLLDLLREQLQLTGTKKGCDHGACGACTVHVGGHRALACMTVAATLEGKDVTTIEGIGSADELHPMQQAFLDCEGFQCGYCTPGQIMSATACVAEGHVASDQETREWMSGNLCRCGAYPNIVDAINQAKTQK